MSMGAIGLNFLITFLFFRDPVTRDEGQPAGKSILQALRNIRETLLNWKYVLFLVIMVLFWTAFNQLYYSFPVFIDHWVDTATLYRGIAAFSPALAAAIGTSEGTITAVTLSSMDSFFIIVFQLVVSAFVMRFRPLAAMMGGILVLAGGLSLMFSMQSGWLILLGVLIFGLGEMASSPKFTEYIGRIAPEDKKALYMGTSFLPVAAGHQLAGWLSGGIYERISDKYSLLAEEVTRRGISLPAISETFSKNDFWQEAASRMGMDSAQLSQWLWQNYHPWHIWYLFSGIALLAMVLLLFYDRFIVSGDA
jgi:dipeptide/tripeptide permease